MSEKANSFKLGLFIITGFLLVVVALAVLGAGEFFKQEFLAETCFDSSVQGLDIGSPVKYRGISIGRVKSIGCAARVYHEKSEYVLVVMALDPDMFPGAWDSTMGVALKQAVAEGLYVQLAIQGLTGTAFLEMDYGQLPRQNKLEFPWKPKHLYVPSEPSTITKIGDALGTIMKNLQAINLQGLTQSIHQLFTRMNQKLDDLDIKAITGQTQGLLSEIRQTNQNLKGLLESERLPKILDSAERAVSGLGDIVEGVKKPVQEAALDVRSAAASSASIAEKLDAGLVPAIEDLSLKLSTILASLNRTSGQLETMVWTNSGGLDDIIANLKLTSENLKQMSQDLKRYPSRLIFEKPPQRNGEK